MCAEGGHKSESTWGIDTKPKPLAWQGPCLIGKPARLSVSADHLGCRVLCGGGEEPLAERQRAMLAGAQGRDAEPPLAT